MASHPTPRTLYHDEVLHLGAWGELFWQRWSGPGEPHHVERMLELHRAHLDRFPERTTVAFSHIDAPRFRPPADGSREPMMAHTAMLKERVRAVATVIDAEGFVGAMVRSTISSLVLVTGRGVEHQVFRHPEQGLRYLARHAPPGSAPSDAEAMIAMYLAERSGA